MFPEVDFVVDSILNFLLVEETDLGWGDTLDAGDVMGVVVFVLVVHVADLVVVDLVLF